MKVEKVEGNFQPSEDGKAAVSEHGMVSTAFPEATRAGVEMLRKGGNAVDAACAAAFALGVCEPQASGLGGQTMALMHFGGKTFALDGSSRVPSLAHLTKINKTERFSGYRSTTVPSTPAVLGYMHFYYGRLGWKTILEPSVSIAKNGYRITKLQNFLQKRELKSFLSANSFSGAGYFLKDEKKPFEVGDLFIQKDLSSTLEYISENGVHGFYRGELAKKIDADMLEHNGFLRADDLALIPWPVERKPLSRLYREFRVYTFPPPGSGRTLLLVLKILGHLPSKFLRKRQPESYHFMAEAFRKAMLIRKERPYDPNIYPQIPDDKKILSRKHTSLLAKSIKYEIDPSLPLEDIYEESGDTTHLSVMDKEGNVVGITQSIERAYGAKTAAIGLGFLYNNYMSALEINDPSHPYYLRPNAVPWSSVAPVIVFYKNKPWLVAGSPGSERIFSIVTQFLSHIIDGALSIDKAMLHPRFHCSVGGRISLEAERFKPEILAYLKKVGYKIRKKDSFAFYLGAIHAVLKTYSSNTFQGIAEIRRDGIAESP